MKRIMQRGGRSRSEIENTLIYSSTGLRAKLIAGVGTSGSEAERKVLERILGDIDRFVRARKHESRELAMMNLLESVVQFWALGKMVQRQDTQAIYHNILKKKLSTKKRPYDYKAEQLYHLATELYEQSARDRDAKAKWNKAHTESGAFVYPETETNYSLSYVEALKKANADFKLFSREEFDEREVELRDSFKTWRTRKR